MKLFVGNLPNNITEDELTSEFKEYGEIHSLKIITDRETGRSRGFGFIEMSDNAARNAIEGLNDTEIQGRRISVNVAQERPQSNRTQSNRRDY
jgi:RNA recognition motif-containing protein